MNILLVRQQSSLEESVRNLVTGGRQGCALFRACDPDRSIEMALQMRPDLILLQLQSIPEQTWRLMAELQEVHPVRVVAIGHSDDAKMILKTLNEGAYKYLDINDLSEMLPAAIRQARCEPPIVADRGNVIALIGSSGGCGVSTLAVNVATSLSGQERSACLIDLHLDGGDLATLLDTHPRNTLADFCQHVDRMDATLFEQCQTPSSEKLALLAAPTDHRDVARVSTRGVRKAITWAKRAFPYVVVDVQRAFQRLHAQALLQSDSVVVVTRPELSSVRRAKLVAGYLNDIGVRNDRVRLVLSRTSRSDALKTADVEEALGHRAVRVIPETSKLVNCALSRGVPVVTDRPRSPLANDYRALATVLNGSTKR